MSADGSSTRNGGADRIETPPDFDARATFLCLRDWSSIRNFLRTEMLDIMVQSGHRFVVLTPDPDNALVRQHFNRPAFILERLAADEIDRAQRGNRLYQFLRLIRAYTYGNVPFDQMGTRRHHLNIFRQETLNTSHTLFGKIFFGGVIVGARLASRMRWLRRLIRCLEYAIMRETPHRALYEKYRPTLLVVPSLGYSLDPGLMREAKRFGTRTLSIVRSWDNTTSKGYAGIEPDHVFTWHDHMSKEAERHHDIPEEKIEIGGIPHWDIYFRQTETPGRQEFMRRYGLADDRRIIYFAMAGPSNFRFNLTLARHLLEAIRSKDIREPSQLLMRIHPNYDLLADRWSDEARDLTEELPKLKEEFGDLLCVSEQSYEDIGEFRILTESNQHDLKAIFSNIDVLVNVYSTQMIEGAIFDVPIINAGYLPLRKTDLKISVYEEFDHVRRIISTGAVTNCHSRDELVEAINLDLGNHSRRSAQRRQLVDQEIPCYRGTASVHMAQRLIKLIEQ